MMKLISFDIFDTTLIRKCGKPDNIFYLLAWKLYPANEAQRDAFLHWRHIAEKRTTLRTKTVERSLKDIYTDSYLDGFPEYTPIQMMTIEMQIESENLIANPTVRTLIRKVRAEGAEICFISDMYLNSDFLVEVLKREGCLEDNERVWVSCEYNARKDQGTLYDVVRQAYKIKHWIHYGDNRYSDIKMARLKGINAQWIDTTFTPVEQRLSQTVSLSRYGDELSLLAGIERTARIVGGNTPIITLAADFVAPAYIPYVIYIMQRARQRGIKRLYFLSRDGYILMKAAQALKGYDDIEIHHLFVSRHSLLLSYLAKNVSEENFLTVIHSIYGQPLEKLLSQLGTNIQEMAEIGISFDYQSLKTRNQRHDFFQKIFHSDYTSILRRRATDARQLLLQYFKQEKLDADEKAALVDVGWLGTSRRMINQILSDADWRSVECFYYATRSDVLSPSDGVFFSYFPCSKLDTNITAIAEHYFSASPYPTTIGYHYESDDKVSPYFPEGKKYKVPPVVQANLEIIKYMMRTMQQLNKLDESILYIWARNSLKSILSFDIRIDLSPLMQQTDFDETPFVRQLTLSELARLILLGDQLTVCDKVSLQLTCGYRAFPLLWNIHQFTNSIRNKVYQILKTRIK